MSAYLAIGDFLSTELKMVYCRDLSPEDYAFLRETVKTEEDGRKLILPWDLVGVRPDPSADPSAWDPYRRLPDGSGPRTSMGMDEIVRKLKGTGITHLYVFMTACHDSPGWTSWDVEKYWRSWLSPQE